MLLVDLLSLASLLANDSRNRANIPPVAQCRGARPGLATAQNG